MAENKDQKALRACLNTLRTAIKKSDAARLADALAHLIALKPERWLKIALLEDVFPKVSSTRSNQELGTLMQALKILIESDALTGDDLQSAGATLLACLDIGQRLERISNQLEGAAFFGRSKSTQIYRLATFLESQYWLVTPEIAKTAIREDRYDPIAALQTSLKKPGIAGGVSPARSWENMAEAVELVLKFLLRRQTDSPFGVVDTNDSPYEAPDFEQVLVLAGAWQDLQAVWSDVRFNGWLPKSRNGLMIYGPPDAADLTREFVSVVRRQRFEAQELMPFVALPLTFSNNEAAVKDMAKTIQVPAAGEVWHPSFNAERLRDASLDTQLLRIVDFYIEHRHYKSLVESLRRGMGPKAITWQEWLSVRNSLYVACEVLAQSLVDQVPDEERTSRSAWVVYLQELADLLAAADGLTPARCKACLDLMTLTYGQKGLGIFDQPLLPISEHAVLVVPSLVILGNPIYSLEHFVSSFGIGDFSKRGIPFERSLGEDLTASGVPSQADVWVRLGDGREMNYDTVAWWNERLLLIEAKCVKTEFSGADDFSTRAAVEESIDQLIRRRESLSEFWAGLRAAVPRLELPPAPPATHEVVCISVTNSMRFAGLSRDGVVCTDDLCLLKYFDPPLGQVYEVDQEGAKLAGFVRNRDDQAGPDNLVKHLLEPPLMRALGGDLSIGLRLISRLPGDPSPLAVPTYEYTGSSASLLQRLGTE